MIPAIPVDPASGRFLPGRRTYLDRRPWLRLGLFVGILSGLVVPILVPDATYLVLAIVFVLAGLLVSPRDDVTAFSILLAPTFLLPANLVIGPLGQVGVPAAIVAGLLFLVWVFIRCAPDLGTDRRFQPMRVVALLTVASNLASYAAGQVRGLSGVESSGADASMAGLAAALGILLFASDGLADAGSVRRVARRIALGAAGLAVVAGLQFFNVVDLATQIRLPGLVLHDSTAEFTEARSGFNRVAGLATHPIEYGVVLSMALPLALHLALTARRGRVAAWLTLALVAGGIPLSVSRSAVLATGTAMVVYIAIVRLRTLLNLLPVVAIGLLGVQGAAPGLLGSIVRLFSDVQNDPSIQGRTGDYDEVLQIFREHPFLGLGPGTYVPSQYRVLDNQFLYQLVTVGGIGLLVLTAMFATGFFLARRVAKHAEEPADRDLGQALAASVAASAVASVTFDSFGFTIMFVTTHVILGCAAALWRSTVRDGRGTPRPGAAVSGRCSMMSPPAPVAR